jgi:uncharacterized membrane protein required for colicin V production
MTLLPADYALIAFTVITAITGLFRGFSGALAFIAALPAAGAVFAFGWPYSEIYTQVVWIRALAVLILALLTFGLVRLIIKKCVNGLLSQPADSIFGFLMGAAVGLIAIFSWAMSGMFLEYSNIASMAVGFIK